MELRRTEQRKPYAVCGHRNLELYEDVNLRDHSTMRVGGSARLFAKVRNVADVECAYEWAAVEDIPVCTIGGGSNIIWADTGYPGLVLQNEIRGFHIVSQDDDTTELLLGAGEVLDEVVERSVQMGLTGIECLSWIPGRVGAAIIQNSGAYGHEIAQVLQDVDVYDTYSHQTRKLTRNACNLGYRSSRFKNEEPGRFVILTLTVRLRRGSSANALHPALLAVMDSGSSHMPTEIRSAVISIRTKKLPDPTLVPNCGSFFTNPIISQENIITALRNAGAPLYVLDSGKHKVAAAWLIERAGLKNHVDSRLGYGTWAGQPLVLFATRPSSCNDLLEYSAMIETAVRTQFGIMLEREPVLIGCQSTIGN
jgi:UDP-N-acetylmuramate dehydrogenase